MERNQFSVKESVNCPNTGGIYAIICTVSNTAYIGSTNSFKLRWQSHRSDLKHRKHFSQHLQNAWSKYGAEHFKFVILERVDRLDLLESKEQEWLDHWREESDTFNKGASGRRGMLGVSLSAETRDKISSSMKGKNKKGRPHTEEEKRNIGLANKGQHSSVGHRHSEATKEKISQSKMGHGVSEYVRTALRLFQKARMGNPENRKTISDFQAKPYPAFKNMHTGEIIPSGVNLTALCRERHLDQKGMRLVALGKFKQHRGWGLA